MGIDISIRLYEKRVSLFFCKTTYVLVLMVSQVKEQSFLHLYEEFGKLSKLIKCFSRF